ncbi:MAG: hypothetical protein EPO36_11930 [Chloroflexota bacterium]|nr:MAG: hypothetical protein EPO36_11930 [Chloroflexota bacterium]
MPDELLRIADGSIEVELLPAVGGRIHRLRAFGHDVLRTPADLGFHRREPFGVGWIRDGTVVQSTTNRADPRR